MFTNNELKNWVENNLALVSKKSFDKFPGLHLLKYKNSVFYKNLWNEYLIQCRGTVVNENFDIISYGFAKIFNYRENNTIIDPHHQVIAVDKINGFLAAVTWYNGDILVSTTGSLTSEHVDMAKEILPLDRMKLVLESYQNLSFCFEIVHPNDPHIISEYEGVYLIGAREKVLGSAKQSEVFLDAIALDFDVFRPKWEYIRFSDLLEQAKTYKREGYVVYDQESDTVLKLKTPYYLTSKFIARIKKLDLIFDRNYKQHFEEEFYSLCEYLQKNYTKEQFLEISEQERLTILLEIGRSMLMFNFFIKCLTFRAA
jgi:ATP-dependent RNA circularization protein (DNA/RNA ligase family)